jgi:parvulin-like peptidyl-prolyl isomerase
MDRKAFTIAASSFFGAFSAVLCLASLHGCDRKSELLAVVNGQPITLKDFATFLANKPRAVVLAENGKVVLPVSGTLGGQAVDDLVKESIELQLAREKGIYPSEQDVKREVDFRKHQSPTFLLDLEAQGLSLNQIRHNLRVSLAEENLVTEGIKVSTDQAKAYIRANPAEFRLPNRVRIAYVLVKDQTAEQAVNEALAGGQSFIDVALKLSQAKSNEDYRADFTDPDLDPPAVSSLPEEVQSAISGVDVSGVSKWVPFEGGYARFYVEKRHPSEPMRIDDFKVESVRRNLARQQGEQVNDIDAIVKQKLARSDVQIFPEAYKYALDDDANSS